MIICQYHRNGGDARGRGQGDPRMMEMSTSPCGLGHAYDNLPAVRLGYRGAGSASDRDTKEDVTPSRCLSPAYDAGPSEGRIAHAGENEGKIVRGLGRDGVAGHC